MFKRIRRAVTRQRRQLHNNTTAVTKKFKKATSHQRGQFHSMSDAMSKIASGNLRKIKLPDGVIGGDTAKLIDKGKSTIHSGVNKGKDLVMKSTNKRKKELMGVATKTKETLHDFADKAKATYDAARGKSDESKDSSTTGASALAMGSSSTINESGSGKMRKGQLAKSKRKRGNIGKNRFKVRVA